MSTLKIILEVFRIRKLKNARKTMVGFGNVIFRIIRNTDKNTYSYGFRILFMDYKVLYSGSGKLKILNPFTLSLIFCIVNLLWVPFITIAFLPYRYFDGARNFIRNTAWYQNVRFFNWVNIALILIGSTLFITKSL